jgi:uncharacterized membrane protein YdbT with pleckstrin-like domain
MSYIDQILVTDERVQAYGRLHWIIYARAALAFTTFLGVLLAAMITGLESRFLRDLFAYPFMGIALYLLAQAAIRAFTTEIAVTDRRVIFKEGLFWRHSVEMNAHRIESVSVSQSILGRILDYGDIALLGTGGGIELIGPVSKPLHFRSMITGAGPRS